MKVHHPKLYNMAHLLSLNILLLPKDLTIIFYHLLLKGTSRQRSGKGAIRKKIPTPKTEVGKKLN